MTREIVTAWARKCRQIEHEADLIGHGKPQAYRDGWRARLLEAALQQAMLDAMPKLPPPAVGCEWVEVEFSLLGSQIIDVEYCPADNQTNRVFINGADISELFADVRADVSMKLDQQAYDAYCKQCEEARAA